MAGHPLIDAHLAQLHRDLPTEAVEELADGLNETYKQYLTAGVCPTEAAAAAIAEFGTPDRIVAAFTEHASGRRIARALLATGPLVAACWAWSLVIAQAWAWPIPPAAGLSLGAALLSAVGVLAIAATSRSYRRTGLGLVGAVGVVALDTATIVLVLIAAPILVWPMAIAIPASLLRAGLTARVLPRLLNR